MKSYIVQFRGYVLDKLLNILRKYVFQLLDIVHPAAKTLVDIAKSQDAEVGDGTTSVVMLAGKLYTYDGQFLV